jgi:hypothetical protein
VRAALADRLTLSEALDLVGKLLQSWPPREVGQGYIGALAAVLVTYPRQAAMRCCDPIKGVARETKFLPTVADLIAWLERETADMRKPVDRDDAVTAQLARRREGEQWDAARLTRPTLDELRAKHGPHWGLRQVDDGGALARHLDAIRRGNERAWTRIGGAVSAGIAITAALIKKLVPLEE